MAKKLKVTNDKVFQRIFGKVGNENIAKGFLEKVLNTKIEDLTLDTNKRLIGESIDEKTGRIDVKAKLSDGTKVIIEMQVASFEHMAERLLYYWARTYTADLKRGMQYENLDKTIAILISAKDLEQTKGIEKYHTKWNIREVDEQDKIYTDDLEIHIIELNKFKGGQENPEDNWIRFIQGGRENMNRIEKFEKELQEAIKQLELIENDPEFREEYEIRELDIIDRTTILAQAKNARDKGLKEGREQGIKEGRKIGIEQGMAQGMTQGIEQGMAQGIEQGIAQGIEKGKKEQQIENIKSMKENGIEIERICKIVNLSEKEVEEILNS